MRVLQEIPRQGWRGLCLWHIVRCYWPRRRSWYIGAREARPWRGAKQSQGRAAEATTTKVRRNQSSALGPLVLQGQIAYRSRLPEVRGLTKRGWAEQARHQKWYAHLGGRSSCLLVETLYDEYQVRHI